MGILNQVVQLQTIVKELKEQGKSNDEILSFIATYWEDKNKVI